MKPRTRALAEKIKLAKSIAKKNNGRIPSPWALIQMGHGTLYRYMLRHKKIFSQFHSDKATLTENFQTYNVAIRKKYLKMVQEIKEQNRGKLPSEQWLMDNGYVRLAIYIKKYPTAFREAV